MFCGQEPIECRRKKKKEDGPAPVPCVHSQPSSLSAPGCSRCDQGSFPKQSNEHRMRLREWGKSCASYRVELRQRHMQRCATHLVHDEGCKVFEDERQIIDTLQQSKKPAMQGPTKRSWRVSTGCLASNMRVPNSAQESRCQRVP